MEFAFNFTFTREDEQHANTYTVGYNVRANNQEEAEKKLRAHNAHLAISKVELFAVRDEVDAE